MPVNDKCMTPPNLTNGLRWSVLDETQLTAEWYITHGGDHHLYLDLRENVDAVSMFQHEDEWRGLHKED